MANLLLHSNLSLQCIFSSPLPIFGAVLPLLSPGCAQGPHSSRRGQAGGSSCVHSTDRGWSCLPLCCAVGMAMEAVPLPMQPGSMTVSFWNYFLSLKSIWFPFCALQCQLINHSASRLILDKTISLSLPAFHKASMYRIKFVVLFPDKNELR